MDRIRALRNPIRHYPWGSHTALAEWGGRASPSPEPEAELWLGAHPSAPSHVVVDTAGERNVPLDEWITRDPVAALGERVAAEFDGQLPFLFKVLAPSRALSIQTHPDAERAERGFQRENEAGLPNDHPERSYRDPRPKPELICALTGFSALCGFQPRDAVAAQLRDLGIELLAAVAEKVETSGSAAGLSELLKLAPAARKDLAESATARIETLPDGDPAYALVTELGRQYPTDVGILAPLFMNAVVLAPGEALFLEAGLVHAYLHGFGIELMGNSDNTLRGGLTQRHIDLPEFLAALDPSEAAPPKLRPVASSAEQPLRYQTPERSFSLQRLAIGPGAGLEPLRSSSGPEIWLCTAGRLRLEATPASRQLELVRGQAAWVPAAAGSFQIEGEGVVHVACMPA